MEYGLIINLLKLLLSGELNDDYITAHQDLLSSVDWTEFYNFLSEHTIAPLFCDLNKFVSDHSDVKTVWRDSTFRNISYYYRLVCQQNQILNAFQNNNIPVVVIKGTAAAKYYPIPQLRVMGDIDLLVKPKDYERAVNCLFSIGCEETSTKFELECGRHRSFHCNSIPIELHHFFSIFVSEEKAKTLDEMLFTTISSENNMLPETENGIVLLSHIRQHLEGGLGLRQIIDWMMFVKCSLNDALWHASFKKKAQKTGLETLAVVVTKMCQKYLGLTTENILWCQDADETLCDSLMKYVMSCGNFGKRRELLQSGSASKLPSFKHPIKLLKYIQSHGEHNWKILGIHPWLKPFAWIYQSCRYINMAFQNKVGTKQIKNIYNEGRKRNEMFAALGIKELQ